MEVVTTVVDPLELNFSDTEQLFFVRQSIYNNNLTVSRPRLTKSFIENYRVEHNHILASGTRTVSVYWKNNLVFERLYQQTELFAVPEVKAAMAAGHDLPLIMLAFSKYLSELYGIPRDEFNKTMLTWTYGAIMEYVREQDIVQFVHVDVNRAIGEVLADYHQKRALEHAERYRGVTRRPVHHSHLRRDEGEAA